VSPEIVALKGDLLEVLVSEIVCCVLGLGSGGWVVLVTSKVSYVKDGCGVKSLIGLSAGSSIGGSCTVGREETSMFRCLNRIPKQVEKLLSCFCCCNCVFRSSFSRIALLSSKLMI